MIRSSGPKDPAVLERNRDLRDAALYRFQTLSESASLLSQAVKDRHPEIPRAAIAGFRNRLVRGYAEVKTERVWEVIAQNLEPLDDVARNELVQLRRQLDRDSGLDIGFRATTGAVRPRRNCGGDIRRSRGFAPLRARRCW